MVWVDAMQRLHLRISKKGDVWHCSEVILNSVVNNIPENSHSSLNVKAYPNPTNSGCQIMIQSEYPTVAEITVIDLQGNRMRSVFTGKIAAGSTRMEWNGKTESGYSVRPGLYLIHLSDKNENRRFKIVKW